MKKKLYIILAVILVLIFFFYKRGMSIESMKHRELKYKELPQELQKLLYEVSNGNTSLPNESLIVLDKKDVYKLEVKKTGPWVDYSLLRKEDHSLEVRIPRGFPHPYIIYNDKIYLSKDYNVISRNNYENIIKSLYHEYAIK